MSNATILDARPNLGTVKRAIVCTDNDPFGSHATFDVHIDGRKLLPVTVLLRNDAMFDCAKQIAVEYLGDGADPESIRAQANAVLEDLHRAMEAYTEPKAPEPTRPTDEPVNGGESPIFCPAYLTVRQLIDKHPELRPPVIHGLLREGETLNIVAPAKRGKSWLVTDLAIAVATGRQWLGQFAVEQGNVLVLDNELHGETIASRIPRVAWARGVLMDDIGDALCVKSLRGMLVDIFRMAPYFAALPKGHFKLIILDALYRFLPPNSDENDNGTMANIYNAIDRYADDLGCSFALVHHATKGNQSGKAITDVGAGAGAQSRATDSHLVLRDHEEQDVVVVEAAVRSWAPLTPQCLHWQFPIWSAVNLDPTKLKGDKREKKKSPWTVEAFTEKFITATPQTEAEIMLAVETATNGELKERRAKTLLKGAVGKELAHLWKHDNPSKPRKYANHPQSETAEQPKLKIAG